MAGVYMIGADLIPERPEAMPEHTVPWTRRWPRALLHLLLPSTCALCGGGCEGVVCAPCQNHFCLPVTNRCGRCANPLPQTASSPRRRGSKFAETTCGTCQAYPPSYDATIAAADYAAP